MNDLTILPIRPGTISAADKRALSKAGVIVIEHDNPSEVRLLRPIAELDSNDLLRCAMGALMVDSGQYGINNRQAFATLVHKLLQGRVAPAPAQSQGGAANPPAGRC